MHSRSRPKPGASAAFVDPRLSADRARPVWLPETGAACLHLAAQPVDAQPGLDVPSLPNIEHILLDAEGRQHIVLRSDRTCMQLTIDGCDAVAGPVAFGLSLGSRRAIDVGGKALATLHGILSASPGGQGASPPWTAETRRFRDALVALDGREAGATLRESAIVIYGRERIDRDWPDSGLRKRLRRDLQRARSLCNGGYRQLLR